MVLNSSVCNLSLSFDLMKTKSGIFSYSNVYFLSWYLDSVCDNLPTGTYDVTISDNGSCIITTPISITAPGFPLQALVSGNMNVCYGSNLGFAVGFGSGGGVSKVRCRRCKHVTTKNFKK